MQTLVITKDLIGQQNLADDEYKRVAIDALAIAG